MQENPSRVGERVVSVAAAEFSRLMRRAAEPASPGELIAHGINRAARRLGLSRRTARAFWYGERARVPADLMERARALAGEPGVREARNELAEMDRRLARIEALLACHPDEVGARIAALLQAARRLDRAVD